MQEIKGKAATLSEAFERRGERGKAATTGGGFIEATSECSGKSAKIPSFRAWLEKRAGAQMILIKEDLARGIRSLER